MVMAQALESKHLAALVDHKPDTIPTGLIEKLAEKAESMREVQKSVRDTVIMFLNNWEWSSADDHALDIFDKNSTSLWKSMGAIKAAAAPELDEDAAANGEPSLNLHAVSICATEIDPVFDYFKVRAVKCIGDNTSSLQWLLKFFNAVHTCFQPKKLTNTVPVAVEDVVGADLDELDESSEKPASEKSAPPAAKGAKSKVVSVTAPLPLDPFSKLPASLPLTKVNAKTDPLFTEHLVKSVEYLSPFEKSGLGLPPSFRPFHIDLLKWHDELRDFRNSRAEISRLAKVNISLGNLDPLRKEFRNLVVLCNDISKSKKTEGDHELLKALIWLKDNTHTNAMTKHKIFKEPFV